LTGWTVVLRGIRYRAGRSLVVVLLGAAATAATVLAPGYSRAAQQSVLTDGLAAAPADATSLQVRSDPVVGESPAMESTGEAKIEINRLLARRPDLSAHFDRPVAGADVDTVLAPPAAEPVLSRLAYRDDVCRHLKMTAGDCPNDGDGLVVVSTRSAAQYGITVGSTITVRGRNVPANATSSDRQLEVAGLYEPGNAADPYWGRGGYFAAGMPESESALPRMDSVFVADEQDVTLPGALPSVHLDYRLKTSTVRLDSVGQLRTDLSGFEREIGVLQMQLSTALRGVLEDIERDATALGQTVPIVTVPLVVLCWFVLFLLVAALTEERSPELALAKLRGYTLGRAARFGRGETLALVLLAAPVGTLAGLALVELAARLMLSPGVHAELRLPVLGAAVLALAVALVAIRFAGRRTLARGVLDLLRRVPERGRWHAGVAEGTVVALAGASLFAAARDQTAPLALLAPALLAVVAGVVASRMLGLWSRLRVRRAARRGRVPGLLAHAQLSRRPLAHRVIVVVTVAVGLLAFAATAWDVAAQARRDVATDSVGAERVLQVGAAHPAALVAAVAAADPEGHSMAVVRVNERYGAGSVEVIGVESARLAEVAVWRGHDREWVASLASKLRPRVADPLPVEGFIQVNADAVTAGDGPTLAGTARLHALVATPSGMTRVSLGQLRAGMREYRAAVAGCGAGCRLLGLTVGRMPGVSGQLAGELRVVAVSTGSGVVATRFDENGRWRVNSARTGGARVDVRPGPVLRVIVSGLGPADVNLEYVETPDALPVAVAGGSPADDSSAQDFTFPALAEQPQSFSVVQREHALPRIGDRGLLFDLDYAVRLAERTSSLSDNSRLHYEVWASGQAPSDLAKRLSAAGLQILREDSIDAELDQLSRAAPALGLRLYLLAGCAAVALAVGAVLLTAYVGAQNRRYEFAALRVAGVRPKLLRRGLIREYVLLLGIPLAVGLFAGMAGAVLMLPGIPLVTVGTPLDEINYVPRVGVLPIAVAVTVAGLVFAVAVALSTVRRGTPDRLREGRP